jgi:hypothetical protein
MFFDGIFGLEEKYKKNLSFKANHNFLYFVEDVIYYFNSFNLQFISRYILKNISGIIIIRLNFGVAK